MAKVEVERGRKDENAAMESSRGAERAVAAWIAFCNQEFAVAITREVLFFRLVSNRVRCRPTLTLAT